MVSLLLGKQKINQKRPGLTIELLKLVEKELKSENVRFRYNRYPWKRCLANLKKNKVDAVLGASFKKSRIEIGHYPMKDKDPDDTVGIASSSYSFYTLKSSKVGWDGKAFSNLKGGAKIGVSAGYSIADDLKKMKINVYSAKGSKNLLEMLLRQRVSGYAGFTDIVDNLIKKNKNK